MAKKTRAELSTEAVVTNLPDNNQELITPATERTQLASERESTLNYKDDITGSVGQALVVGADGESVEFEDFPASEVKKTGTITAEQAAFWNNSTDTLRSEAAFYKSGGNFIITTNLSAIGGRSLNAQFLNLYDNPYLRIQAQASGTAAFNSLDLSITAGNSAKIRSSKSTGAAYQNIEIETGGSNTMIIKTDHGVDVVGTLDVGGAATFSGDVGIGTAPASGVKLDVRSNASATIGDFRNASATGYGFYIAAGDTSSQYALKVADYANNDLVVVRGDGLLQANYGISFPNGGVTTLDYYEEGTWIPTFAGNTIAGTYTTSSVTATYTRIGNLCTVQCDTSFSAASGGTGSYIVMGGFPYSYNGIAGFTNNVSSQNLTYSGELIILPTGGGPGSTFLLAENKSGLGYSFIPPTSLTTSVNIRYTYTYKV
jgi:hypothetical protein